MNKQLCSNKKIFRRCSFIHHPLRRADRAVSFVRFSCYSFFFCHANRHFCTPIAYIHTYTQLKVRARTFTFFPHPWGRFISRAAWLLVARYDYQSFVAVMKVVFLLYFIDGNCMSRLECAVFEFNRI